MLPNLRLKQSWRGTGSQARCPWGKLQKARRQPSRLAHVPFLLSTCFSQQLPSPSSCFPQALPPLPTTFCGQGGSAPPPPLRRGPPCPPDSRPSLLHTASGPSILPRNDFQGILSPRGSADCTVRRFVALPGVLCVPAPVRFGCTEFLGRWHRGAQLRGCVLLLLCVAWSSAQGT